MACIEARGLRKSFGTTVAVDGVDLRVEEGRILGLIGPNGAGKTTALNAILGLIPYQGKLKVLGRDPWTERERLMCDVCFISDVAILPRWLRVSQAIDYVAGVHPRFDRRHVRSADRPGDVNARDFSGEHGLPRADREGHSDRSFRPEPRLRGAGPVPHSHESSSPSRSSGPSPNVRLPPAL